MEEVTKERVVEELAQIAFFKATDIVTVQQGVLTVADIPAGAAGAVQSVEKTASGLRVKFYDKLKALELLGKATGLFDSMVDAGGSNLLDAIVSATKQEVDTDGLQELL